MCVPFGPSISHASKRAGILQPVEGGCLGGQIHMIKEKMECFCPQQWGRDFLKEFLKTSWRERGWLKFYQFQGIPRLKFCKFASQKSKFPLTSLSSLEVSILARSETKVKWIKWAMVAEGGWEKRKQLNFLNIDPLPIGGLNLIRGKGA